MEGNRTISMHVRVHCNVNHRLAIVRCFVRVSYNMQCRGKGLDAGKVNDSVASSYAETIVVVGRLSVGSLGALGTLELGSYRGWGR